MTAQINIELCKVLYKDNEPYIAIIASCPTDYHFNQCIITDHNFASGVWTNGVEYDVIAAFGDEQLTTLQHLIPLGIIASNPNDIYSVVLKATNNESEITADAVISDVRFVYDCLIDKLIHSTEDCCQPVSDDIIRMYLTLYGHTTAMQYGDIPTAKEMYTRLIKCGCKCPSVPKTSCGCKR